MPEDPNLDPETDPIEPETAPNPEQPPITPTVPEIDYKEKFAESTRENQLLRERIAQEEKARQEQIKEPTEPELRATFPQWDSMSDTEKELARQLLVTKATAGRAAQYAQEDQANRSWNTSIELVLTSNNALHGKEQAFRAYANRPQYRNVPMDVLVNSFLQTQPAPAPTVTPRKPGLEPGGGGPRNPEKPKGLTTEQLTALRTSNPKGYQDYIKKHDITLED